MTDLCLFSNDWLKQIKQKWKQHAIYWVILALYLSMRLFYFGTLGDVEASGFVSGRTDYVLTQWVVTWKYIKMIIWPTGLSFEHAYGPLTHLMDIRVLVGAVLYGILVVGFMRALKSSRQNVSLLLYGASWFFITLSPTSSVFPTTAMMAENRVYLPLTGFCLIAPCVAHALTGLISTAERSRIFVILFGIYAFSLGSITLKRNIFYQDPVAIWQNVLQQYSADGRARRNLAVAYTDLGRFNEASLEYERILLVEPNDLEVRNNLAAIYLKTQQYEKSLATFEYIISKKPDFAAAYSNIGLVYERLGNFDAAEHAYKTALRLNPMLMNALFNLGDLYLKKGRLKEAAVSYQALLRLDPRNEYIIKKLEIATRQSQITR